MDKFEIIEKDTLRKCFDFFYDFLEFIDQIKSYALPCNIFLGTEDFTTDDNGNITFIEFFDVSGESEMKFSMILDKSGRCAAHKQFSNNKGDKLSEENMVFNPEGFIKTKTEVNEREEINIWKYEYMYDKYGNWIQCIASKKNTSC